MAGKRHDTDNGRAADPAARSQGQREGHDAIDPTLAEDLGAEFEFRGDVVDAERREDHDLLEQARAAAEEYKDRFTRLQAEWDNFRKRLASERETERIRANEQLVQALLPVLDDMERALDHAHAGTDEGASVSSFADGIEAVHSKFIKALEGVSVEVIDPTNQPFDATRHNAVQKVENADMDDETVVTTIQKGYEMGGYVIRPAMVIVSTGGPKPEKG